MSVEATAVTIYAGDTVLVADAPAWLQLLEPRSALALPAWRGTVLLPQGVRLPGDPVCPAHDRRPDRRDDVYRAAPGVAGAHGDAAGGLYGHGRFDPLRRGLSPGGALPDGVRRPQGWARASGRAPPARVRCRLPLGDPQAAWRPPLSTAKPRRCGTRGAAADVLTAVRGDGE
jgi:hypothetical protein